MKQLIKKIKELAYQLGADVCGIGSINRFENAPAGFSPLDLFDQCQSVIALGLALPKGLYEVPPRLLYGHFNRKICSILDAIELKLARELEERFNCLAVPVPCDAPNEYWDAENMTAKGLISMRHTAVLCGLGSIGKSSLLINPEYGNRLTIGAVLTDLELESDDLQPDLCIAECSRCLDSCPVQAIADKRVNQKLCRLNTYGKTARGFDTVNCNKCRTVCPVRFGKTG
ncbi:MAG TPA: epoxyqueuosine reductase [Thermoclostridium caenicola]|uniref:epoxyqueuosine reductase n=1 Tax=Thermoclostridium caenicola TaxID=659425 RepID=UPI002C6B2834|nr:epoxyqueuosine reductase [Thermoclostridium caenicola]HPO78002.1 epoxyqueuosine reductase [Thermoclostridium caenicola]